MRRLGPLLFLALATACPSLDGFSGKQPGGDAGDAAAPDSGALNGYLSLSEAARFCKNVFACPYLAPTTLASLLIPLDAGNYSACVDWLAGPVPPDRVGFQQQQKQLQCAADANSCPEANACFLLEEIDPSDPRCNAVDAGPNGGCSPDGRSVYRCSAGYILHCDNSYYYPGSTCLLNSQGEYWCAVSGNCTLPQEGKCVGTSLTYCGLSGETEGVECAMSGYTCAKDLVSGWFYCLLNGEQPSCTTDGTACAGDKVRVCRNGSYTDFNCASLSGSCNSLPAPRCTRSSDECSQTAAQVNVCDGDKIKLCVGGKFTNFDCTSISAKCVQADGGASAHCE